MRNFSANFPAARKSRRIENAKACGDTLSEITHLDKWRAESSMKKEKSLSTESHGIFKPTADEDLADFAAKIIVFVAKSITFKCSSF